MQLNKREILKTYVETDCQGKINLTRWGYNCQGCWGEYRDMKLAESQFPHSSEGRGHFASGCWELEEVKPRGKVGDLAAISLR